MASDKEDNSGAENHWNFSAVGGDASLDFTALTSFAGFILAFTFETSNEFKGRRGHKHLGFTGVTSHENDKSSMLMMLCWGSVLS